MSEICNFFEGKSIFITGATGFLGKVLIRKLLSTCKVEKIYCLIREQKGETSSERAQKEILNTLIFKDINIDKLEIFSGDLLQPNMGLNCEDEQKLINSVQVIFHMAATIRFEEELKTAVKMNVETTNRVIEFAKLCPKMAAFVHVSTAFSQCDKQFIEEKLYNDIEYEAQDLLNMSKINEASMIGSRPNTYTFTKAMAEQLFLKENCDFPIAIIRPSIVCAAEEEPMPGWVDNINGMTGIYVAAGCGLLRSAHVDGDCLADLIPVDKVINLMCASAYAIYKNETKTIYVYHATTGTNNPVTWGEAEKLSMPLLRRYPCEKMIWYPGGRFYHWQWLVTLSWFFTNWLPAYTIDAILFLLRQKPFLVRANTKILKNIKVLGHFVIHEWLWEDAKTRSLWRSLNNEDKLRFNFDVKTINWPIYFRNYVLGTRQYVLKNEPATLTMCQKRLKKFKLVNDVVICFVCTFISFLLIRLLCVYSES